MAKNEFNISSCSQMIVMELHKIYSFHSVDHIKNMLSISAFRMKSHLAKHFTCSLLRLGPSLNSAHQFSIIHQIKPTDSTQLV